jgi:type I restriction enzyme S subunit
MKQNWEVKKLSQIFDIKSSKRVHQADWKSNGIPFYRAREVVKLAKDGYVLNELFISEELYEEFIKDKGAPKAGDIIVSAVGTLGQCYLVKDSDKFYFKDASVLWFENISNVNSRYIEYSFQSDYIMSQVMDGSMGATVGTLTIRRAKDIEIPLPPLHEQQRILVILDEAFTAIDKAKANTEQNLKNAKELFESELQSVFNAENENWNSSTLKKLGTITSSKRIYKSEYVENGIPFYRTKEIKELSNGKEITLELYISKERYYDIKKSFGVPKIGDLLMSAVGTIGEIMVIENEDEFYFKDGNIVWFKDFNELDTNYLKYALTAFVEKIKSLAIGAAYSALTIEKLNQYKISFPKSLKDQQTIVSKLDALREQTKKLEAVYEKKLQDLEELKKSVLSKAFSGEL